MASKTETIKRIKYYSELRDATLSALQSLTEVGDVESYSLSDADGSQNVRRRKIDELRKALAEYENKIDNLESGLQGGGLRTFSTNRYA